MDLWHGACRGVSFGTQPADSEFRITAPYPTWKRVIEGKVDPIRAIMTRQLQVDGPMTRILKSPKAAVELVNCARQLETSWA
jgi:putative sterol carrier protein